MFKNILIPISSESYQKNVLEKGIYLAEKFKSTITFMYIIEEKTLNQTDKRSDSYLSPQELFDTKKEIISKQKQTADYIVFDEVKFLLKNKKIDVKEKVTQGEFSDAVKRELSLNKYDLILMSFEKECLLNYRLLEEVDIPVWIETEKVSNVVLAVCSNLAPNQKVPDISIKLSKKLNLDLHMLYVVDREDAVHVDEIGRRSDKKSERDLLFEGQKFVENMKKKGIKTSLVKGKLEKQTIKAAEKLNAYLIIVGREQKKKGTLGIPIKNLKKRIATKCKYSILFLN